MLKINHNFFLSGIITFVVLKLKNLLRVRYLSFQLSKDLSMFYHRQPATGVPGAVISSEGYRRLQELDGKRRETIIYTGSARRKVTAPYVQSGVDSILRPTLFIVLQGMLWL